MPIETYRTWVVDAVLTAAQMNEQIRDNGNELSKGGFTVVFDGAGAPIVVGTRITIPETAFKFAIDAVTLKSRSSDAADSDTFVLDILVPTAPGDQADSDDSICGAALPTLDSDNPNYKRDTSLTGWSPTINENKSITFVVNTNGANITKAQLGITYTRAS